MTRQKIRETLERLNRLANTPQFMLVSEASETARDALTLLREITSVDADVSRYAIDMTAETMEGIDSERKAVAS